VSTATNDSETLPRARLEERTFIGRFVAEPSNAEALFALGVTEDAIRDPFLRSVFRVFEKQHHNGGINIAVAREQIKPRICEYDLNRDEFDELADFAPSFSSAQFAAIKIIEVRNKLRLLAIAEDAASAARNGHSFHAAFRTLCADLDDLKGDSVTKIELRKASSVEPREVDWAWPGYLHRGGLTLLDGDPERAKSQISCDVTGRWTYPRPFPFVRDHELHAAGNVLMFATEDGEETTIRPRLDAAGANTDRVFFWPIDAEPITLPSCIDTLAAAVKQYDISLLVLDPLGVHLDETVNANRDTDVRRALRPLVALAQETNLAVLAVRHLNKDENKSALYRGGGSIAFTAAARVVWAVGTDPTDPNRLILAVLKSNIGIKPPALTYTIEGVGRTSRIRWEGESTCSIGDIFNRKHQRGVKGDDAERIMRDLLADGCRPEAEVREACYDAGIRDWTYKQARKRLGVTSTKGSMREGWLLSLPEEVGQPEEDGESC
jgi:hypothetical protein